MVLVIAASLWSGYRADALELLEAIREFEILECGSLTVINPGDTFSGLTPPNPPTSRPAAAASGRSSAFPSTL